MELGPFSFEEAIDICDDFEDLKDTEFNTAHSGICLVNDVVISPFSAKDKKSFTDEYLKTKNAPVSIAFYAGSGGYDVLLYISDVDDETIYSFIDIRSFAEERGIKYYFPRVSIN